MANYSRGFRPPALKGFLEGLTVVALSEACALPSAIWNGIPAAKSCFEAVVSARILHALAPDKKTRDKANARAAAAAQHALNWLPYWTIDDATDSRYGLAIGLIDLIYTMQLRYVDRTFVVAFMLKNGVMLNSHAPYPLSADYHRHVEMFRPFYECLMLMRRVCVDPLARTAFTILTGPILERAKIVDAWPDALQVALDILAERGDAGLAEARQLIQPGVAS
jgi:hypothetical protein